MAVPGPPSDTGSIALNATCHCTLFHATYTLPSSSLPLKSSICQCNTCRKTSGHLFGTFAVIPSPQRPDLSALTAYASSDALTRYFCPRCGASVANVEPHEWEFTTGVLDRTGGGLLDRVQMWFADTKDGGAALWLNDPRLERHTRERTSQKLTFEDVKTQSDESRSKTTESRTPAHEADDLLRARCHCNAVSFQIARPEPSPDGRTAKNTYPAGLDACTSCRTVTGFEITSWAFVPRNRLRSAEHGDQPIDLLDLPAVLSYYKTSPAMTRGFCSTCGANVFAYGHRGHTGREDTIDIAAGLLESRAGVRAEDWLVWDHYGEDIVAHRKDALDGDLVEGLIGGIRADRGGGK